MPSRIPMQVIITRMNHAKWAMKKRKKLGLTHFPLHWLFSKHLYNDLLSIIISTENWVELFFPDFYPKQTSGPLFILRKWVYQHFVKAIQNSMHCIWGDGVYSRKLPCKLWDWFSWKSDFKNKTKTITAWELFEATPIQEDWIGPKIPSNTQLY